MANRTRRNEYKVSMRLPEADLAIIDRAAHLRGRSRTDFMREAAVRSAEEAFLETRPIRMSEEAFGEFLSMLARPAAAVSRIVETAKRPAPWEPGYVAKK